LPLSFSRVEVRAKSYRTTKNLFAGKYIDLFALKRWSDLLTVFAVKLLIMQCT